MEEDDKKVKLTMLLCWQTTRPAPFMCITKVIILKHWIIYISTTATVYVGLV